MVNEVDGDVWKLGVLVMTFDGVVEVVAVSGSRPQLLFLMMVTRMLLLLLVLWW